MTTKTKQTRGKRQVGMVITNFWSIVLDDHWSKKIYRPQIIVDVRCYIHLSWSCYMQSEDKMKDKLRETVKYYHLTSLVSDCSLVETRAILRVLEFQQPGNSVDWAGAGEQLEPEALCHALVWWCRAIVLYSALVPYRGAVLCGTKRIDGLSSPLLLLPLLPPLRLPHSADPGLWISWLACFLLGRKEMHFNAKCMLSFSLVLWHTW